MSEEKKSGSPVVMNVLGKTETYFLMNKVHNQLRKSSDPVHLGALGLAIFVLVETVEMLKKYEIVVVNKIETSFSQVNSKGKKFNKARLDIHVSRGPKHWMLLGRKQQRVVEFYGNLEKEPMTMILVAALRQALDRCEHYKKSAAEYPDILKAPEAYLKQIEKEKKPSTLTIMEFMQYFSLVSNCVPNDAFESLLQALVDLDGGNATK